MLAKFMSDKEKNYFMEYQILENKIIELECLLDNEEMTKKECVEIRTELKNYQLQYERMTDGYWRIYDKAISKMEMQG